MKTLKILLGICCFMHGLSTSAKNYYFSSSSGNDTRTIIEAQNMASPWNSIQQLNNIANQLSAGDSVLFRCGDTFYGTITATRNGVVYSSYGTGSKPIISGFTDVTAWTNIGGNIWESTSAVSKLSTCNMVVINNNNTPVGRAPNTGYYTIASHTSKTSLTSISLNSGTNWTGAEAVIKTSDWTINRSTITSQANNLINFDGTPLNYEIKNGYGFFLQKDIRTLDTLNEWYFNPNTKKLSVYSLSMPTSVKVATVDNLFWINGILSNITIKDIAFEGSNASAIFRTINSTPPSNIVVKKCNINYSGFCAIELRVNGILIDSNAINNSNDRAISVQYSKNATIINNIIRNSGIIAGMGANNSNASSAVTFGGFADSRSTVMYNTITNTGHNGMIFGIDTAYVAYNRIDSFNLVIDDAAGIYGYGSSNPIITKNIVSNAIGALQGTNRTGVLSHGIYLDDNCNNATVTNNSIFNIATNGIVVHNSWSNNVSNNTIYNSGLASIAIVADVISGPTGRIRNNRIKNNLFIAKEISQLTAQIASTINDLDSIGILDSNVYARPLDDILSIQTKRYISGILYNDWRDLESWRTNFSKDANSKTSRVKVLPYNSKSQGGNKISNGFFTSNIIGVNFTTKSAGSSIVRDATVLDSGSLKCNALEKVTMLINTTSISNTKQYVLKFTATATAEVNLLVYIIGATTSQTIKIFPYRKDYEIVFSNPTTTTSPIISVNGQSFPVTFWLDNIVFTEAVVTPILSKDVFRFEYNPTNTTKKVILNGRYLGVDSTIYNDTIMLAPFSSRVLINVNTQVNQPVNTLPVKLLSFAIDDSKENVPVLWTTTQEINSSHYLVERSKDGKSFETIGQVISKNSIIGSNYKFTDEHPLSGISYYRLAMVDKDGSKEYSKIINVKKNSDIFNIGKMIFMDKRLQLQVNSNTQQIIQYFVVDVAGRLYHKQTVLLQKGNNNISQPIPSLNNGIYYLKLFTAQANIVKSFIGN